MGFIDEYNIISLLFWPRQMMTSFDLLSNDVFPRIVVFRIPDNIQVLLI